MYRIPVVCAVTSFLALSSAQVQQQTETDKLPIQRIVLYKNGVGYFEHLGRVRGSQDVTIPFTSGQLNDVLKTLTVLDLDGGRIASVAYDSSTPIDRQLSDMHLPYGEKTSLSDYLGALRGVRLEVRNGTAVTTGRLLSVERKTRISGGTTLEVDYLSLITDAGELKTTEVSPLFSIRLLDRGMASKLGHFLDIVAAARDADVRRMVVSSQGNGERSLFVSYISEVPVWKATYRIVLKKNSNTLLQGWAIVDNVTGEDWDKVTLSLVAGAPQSFIQNLSQPYYARRPVVPLPESTNPTPQTFEATLLLGDARLSGTITDPSGALVANATVKVFANGALAGQTQANSAGEYQFQSLPEGPVLLQVDSPGFQRAVINGIAVSKQRNARQDVTLNLGAANSTVDVTASAPRLQAQTAELVQVQSRGAGSGSMLGSGAGLGGRGRTTALGKIGGASGGGVYSVSSARERLESAAAAQELGDLFEYQLKEPITIRKDRSALVPIVQSNISSEKVSVWNEQSGLRRPERALWLTNSSGLTLDGGCFSVLEEETFAGEGIFEPIRPGEKRLVSYAADLALNASSKIASDQQRVSQVSIHQGVLTQTSEIRERKTYTFRNEDSSPRVVIVEHAVRTGYELRGDVHPAETTDGWMRFRLSVDPKQTSSLTVDEARPMQTTYQVSNITNAEVAVFIREKSIDTAIEEALRRIVAQKAIIADLDSKKEECDDQIEKIFDDQQRLRENMKALKGSAEEKALLQRYTQHLDQQENRLAALRKESEQLEGQQDSAQSALDKMIQELSFDVKR